jgi:hypothetical protein
VLVDLDGDGALDVVSSCEGNVRTVFVHWAPRDNTNYLDESTWKTEALPASVKRMQWMWCLPMQVDGRGGIDLVCGGKGPNAAVGWFEAPPDPRDLPAWQWHPLVPAGWIMSIIPSDMDDDGDVDLAISDRYGARRGCYWLENPGRQADLTKEWKTHRIGADGLEVLFMTLADLDRDGLTDALVAAKPRRIIYMRRLDKSATRWQPHTITLPDDVGRAKCVAVGDVNGEGKPDMVYTTEGATDGKSGVVWLSYRNSPEDENWDIHEISGSDGIKHDLAELIDLDGDGDLDVVTCEETKNLGVFWYENPLR